jgi:hypothetical protein
MEIRSIHVALICIAASLPSASAAAQAGEHRTPGTKVVRSGDHEAVLVPFEEARAAMSDDERALLELREQMRALRAERREAIRAARQSGDPMAMARVQEQFRPRMEALRDQVSDARDVVMERRLAENPELAARLGAAREGRGGHHSRERFDCGRAGHADDTARRRAFRRLRAIAPEGSLAEPSDIPTPVREELKTHARRVALLQCARARARAHDDLDSAARARGLLRTEQRRHDAELRRLFGAPALPAPADPHAATSAPEATAAEPAHTRSAEAPEGTDEEEGR